MEKFNHLKNAEDFVLDPEFLDYILSGIDNENRWKNFIAQNPQLQHEIELARELILLLNSSIEKPVPVNKIEELAKLRQRIKLQKRTSMAGWLKYAAAVLVFIALGYLLKQSDTLWYKTYVAQEVNQEIMLSDQTEVDIHKGASFRVSRFYGYLNREVQLSGEAFFRVTKHQRPKFVVNLGTCDVTVLGTQFYVSTNCENSTVMVDEGKVAYRFLKDKSTRVLTKGMSANYDLNEGMKDTHYDANQFGWSSGVFNFHNTTLTEIARQLGDFYNTPFVVDPKYNQTKLSLYFDNMKVDEVLKLFTDLVPEMHYEIQPHQIKIY